MIDTKRMHENITDYFHQLRFIDTFRIKTNIILNILQKTKKRNHSSFI